MKKIFMTLCLLMLAVCAGCAAMENMTVVEKARTTGYEMSNTYKSLYASYKLLEKVDTVTIPDEVATSMNKVKQLLIDYNDAAILLSMSGATSTEDLNEIETNIKALLADITIAITKLGVN